MENNFFVAINDEELFDIMGGNLFEDIGYFCHGWCDFWMSFGEGLYDGLH